MSQAQPDENVTADAGSSADQHVTGTPETGTFLTDEPPTADTPADGSSNAGLNAAGHRTVVPGGDAGRAAPGEDAGRADPAEDAGDARPA